MIRTIGAILIGFGTAYAGYSFSAQLARQVQTIALLRDSVVFMRQKIAYYRMPLPALLQELSIEQANSLSPFYLKAAARLEENRTRTAEAVLTECFDEENKLGLPSSVQRSCRNLFRGLGRSDAAHLPELLNRVIAELDACEIEAKADLARRKRCYCAIGLCGGMAMTILLV